MHVSPVSPGQPEIGGEQAREGGDVGAGDGGHLGTQGEDRPEEFEVEIEKDDDAGERQPKAKRRPHAPTKSQIEEHFPCHAHYRSWCPDCRAGRSLGKKHMKQDIDEDDSLGPVISLDYAFKESNEEGEIDLSPLLIAYDHNQYGIWVLEVDEKGVESGVGVEWLHRKIEFAGYGGMKVTLRSDGEPSILAVKRAIAVRRGVETGLIESPVRQSKSNGKIERAIRSRRDQYRTLRHQYERRMKAKLLKNSVLSSWLASWAAEVMNRCKVQENGRTAFEMMTHHKSKVALVGFGERVHFQHTKLGKDEYRKDDGVFLGVTDRSSTYLIGNSNGISAALILWPYPTTRRTIQIWSRL